MQLPRVIFRSLLSAAVIAILLGPAPCARAADAITSQLASSSTRTGSLFLTPANLQFGKVAVGRRKLQTVTITNRGNSNITLSQVIKQGKDFVLSGLDLPLTLASGESFTFSGVFAPRSRGSRSGTISFVSDVAGVSSPMLMLHLAGVGADAGWLTVDPARMNFGSVQVGSSAMQGGTLTAVDGEVTISFVSISNPEFVLGGLSLPVTIPAGGSQGFMVTFTPQAVGTASASLYFLDSGDSPLAVESLTGTGTVSQGGHSVDLSWNASTSQDVIGYNVYRGTRSGGPYSKINSVLDPNLAYTDVSVTDGMTYYYVTTAVDSNHQESVYSNQAQAIIP